MRSGRVVVRARRLPQPRHPAGLSAPDPRRRLLAFLLAVCLAFVAVGVRLAFIQGIDAGRYVAVGEGQRLRNVVLPAERGAIFDRNGRELAMSVSQKTVWANPHAVSDPAGEAHVLAPILGVEENTLRSRLSEDAAFVYLARKVDDAVAKQVEARHLDGVSFLEEPKRFLPAGDLAKSLIGMVGTDNGGLSGLELQFDHQMAGRPGELSVERDPAGHEIPAGQHQFKAATRGDDLVLTVDRSLQYETEQALAGEIVTSRAKGGIAIVMNPRTGEILAMADLVAPGDGSAPKPAPNNLAVTNVYEPGSVNKVITISAALEEGLFRASDVLAVPDHLQVADAMFRDHEPHDVKNWSITDILANSSNVGTIMIGQKLGKARIDRYLRAFGLGRHSGLGFPGEPEGLLLDPKRWSGTSIGTVPIGQGLAVTALQMLDAYNIVANDGVWVQPNVVKAVVDGAGRQQPAPAPERRRVVSVRTARQVTAMLAEVVRAGTGTGAAIDGYMVAGKTGTARKPLEGARGYKVGAYVATFAGFVPAEAPQLSAIVVLDEPTPIYGGLTSAPVFAAIAKYGLRQFRIPPPARGGTVPVPAVADPARPDSEFDGVGRPATTLPPSPSSPSGATPSSTAPPTTP